MSLRGDDGALLYRATLVPSDGERPPAFELSRTLKVDRLPPALYNDTTPLFHGPAFQVITALRAISDEGAVADLVGLDAMGWPPEPWALDPAALDGAIQLGALWTQEVLGVKNLPMGVQAVIPAVGGPLPGPLRAFVRRREVHARRAVADLRIATADGRALLDVLGAEFVERP